VKMLLLTATRRSEVADMTSAELDGELWTIPAARYKTSRETKLRPPFRFRRWRASARHQ